MEVSNRISKCDDCAVDEAITLLTRNSQKQEQKPLKFTDSRKIYSELKASNKGLITGISELDTIIGGMSYGTVNTIMAYTAHFKSLWSTNIAYINSYKLGYNVCFISLEVSKSDILWNILSRHSQIDKFSKFNYIPHDEIRKAGLSEEKEDFLFDEVAKDLEENTAGKLVILDETDFKEFSFSEIMTKLYEVDDTVGGLDAVIFDHAGLFKFYKKGGRSDEGEVINEYISFIRKAFN